MSGTPSIAGSRGGSAWARRTTVCSVSPASRMDKRRRREGDPLLSPMPRRNFGGEIRASPQHTAVPTGYSSGKGTQGGFNHTKPARSPPQCCRIPITCLGPSGAWEKERALKFIIQKKKKIITIWKNFSGSNLILQRFVWGNFSQPVSRGLIPAGRDFRARCSPRASVRCG